MTKPDRYVTIDSYATAKRIPIDVATEQVQSGKVAGKKIDGAWFVSEEATGISEGGAPGIITLLYFAAIATFVLALVVSSIYLPNGYSIPVEAYLVPGSILLSGLFSTLILAAMAKGLSLLYSISISVRSNA